ncbi:glycosyl hydrolase family 28-related protein [Cohnella sp. 56]|uniref:glycosyl hydrolase family 28-related protein n=1 Tax=Cohnella sp. 56 TaxID=3113722 RepID=UPI0030E9A473
MSLEDIAKVTQETYQDYDKIKGFDDVGHFLKSYVVSGAVASKNVYRNNVVDVTGAIAVIGGSVMKRDGTAFMTATPNTTYYLDFKASGDFSWLTSHAPGAAGTDYITLAEVTTDANGNVSTIIDKADPRGGFRLSDTFGLEGYATSAQLADIAINVKSPPAPLIGAKGDDVTNDTAAIHAIISYARANGKNVILFPAGKYRVNLVVSGLGLIIQGRGVTGLNGEYNGSVLLPADASKPVLQIGDGTTLTSGISVNDFAIDAQGQTGGVNGANVGLYVYGAEHLSFNNLYVARAKQKNIYISSSSSRRSSIIYFNRLDSSYGLGSNLYVEWGLTYTTGVYVEDFYCMPNESFPTTSHAITLDSVDMTLNDAYVDCPNYDSCGLILKKTFASGAEPQLRGENIALDNVGKGKVVVYDSYRSSVGIGRYGFFQGVNLITNGGVIEYSNGTKTAIPDPITILGNGNKGTKFGFVEVNGSITIISAATGTEIATISGNGSNLEVIASQTGADIYMKPGNGGRHRHYGGNYFVPLYYEYGSNMFYQWLDSNGYLRIKAVTDPVAQKPAGESEGIPVISALTGTTAQRPGAGVRYVGMMYFDTTLGKPIWRSAAATWVDATGTTVG